MKTGWIIAIMGGILTLIIAPLVVIAITNYLTLGSTILNFAQICEPFEPDVVNEFKIGIKNIGDEKGYYNLELHPEGFMIPNSTAKYYFSEDNEVSPYGATTTLHSNIFMLIPNGSLKFINYTVNVFCKQKVFRIPVGDCKSLSKECKYERRGGWFVRYL